ncbi:MAG TPA: hypothetical protein PL182_13810 [Pseudobdellovibrionaceae bacterium]|nr:hypothetical protein [Pseudobdellovibrionaceae bacterium]
MRKRQPLFLLIGAFLLAASFQNCAPSELVFEDIQLSEEKAFFDYPYKTAPEFYGNVLLFQENSSVVNLSNFKFVGTASYLPDETKDIVYSIKIVNADLSSDIVCPQADGTLLASLGQSTIEFDCVTAATFKTMKVIMTLQVGVKTATIEKLYQK